MSEFFSSPARRGVALLTVAALSGCGGTLSETHSFPDVTTSDSPSPDTSGTFPVCNNIYEGVRGDERLLVFQPAIRMLGKRAMVVDAEATPEGLQTSIVELNADRANTSVQTKDVWLDLQGKPGTPDCTSKTVYTSRIKLPPKNKETWVASLQRLPDQRTPLDLSHLAQLRIVAHNFGWMPKTEAREVLATINAG